MTDVVQISRVNGTGDEGQVLPQWSDEQHLRSIVVVATKDHSRRVAASARSSHERPIRHISQFKPRAIQILAPIDGGKLAAASGQKSSNSRNSARRRAAPIVVLTSSVSIQHQKHGNALQSCAAGGERLTDLLATLVRYVKGGVPQLWGRGLIATPAFVAGSINFRSSRSVRGFVSSVRGLIRRNDVEMLLGSAELDEKEAIHIAATE